MARPIEESERRVESLRRYVASCRRALGDLGVLLSAEQAGNVNAIAAVKGAEARYAGREFAAAGGLRRASA